MKTKDGIVQWIKEEMVRNGGKTVVIGLSGGKDSAVVAALCVEALGKENVYGVMMPNGEGRDKDITDALELAKHLDIKCRIINICETVKSMENALSNNGRIELSRQTKLNIPPRVRMITLYGIAQSLENCRVTCNSNLSEDWVGYSTVYGDTAGAFSPIGMMTSDKVIALGMSLGVPSRLLIKSPEDGLTGRIDEEVWGFSYDVLNKYIRHGVCEDKEIKEKIDKLHKSSRFKYELIPKYKG